VIQQLMNLPAILVIISTAALMTAVLCQFSMPISTKFNLLDIPAGRKKHVRATPLMGGVVLMGVFLPFAIALVWLATPQVDSAKLGLGLAAISGLAMVGLLDDRHSLSPRLRLVLSFLIFGLVAFGEPIYNVRILDFENPAFAIGLGTKGLAAIFTIICCVGLMNAINMADGKNGLVIGLCIGWLGLLAWRSPPVFLPIIALIMVTLSVLLVYNLRGKLFLGDGGAYGIAGAISILTIAIYNSPGAHATRALSADEIVLMFSVPVFDSFRLTFKRMKRGLSPMAADRDHLHHHLLDQFGWPKGLLLYWAVSLVPAALYFSM
jgi:UDP-GlcNAc:undecaprenyl-phosphate/decaprenyl-phosphate GlcNAc-1-phosphate transferase